MITSTKDISVHILNILVCCVDQNFLIFWAKIPTCSACIDEVIGFISIAEVEMVEIIVFCVL